MNFRKYLSLAKRHLYRPEKPSLNNLDDKLQKHLNFDGGFFIEAGANDGYTQSNTYYLEKRRGWRGVLVEGVPDLYNKCLSKRPSSIVHGCALVAEAEEGETVTMHYANLMSVVEGAMKTKDAQKKHIEAGLKVQYLDSSYEVEVPARTMESILDEVQDLPQIDFLSLDVEGYELEVLKGVNLSKYSPAYILVEARFFDDVDSFLRDFSYTMLEKMSNHDYLYKSSRS